MASSTFTRRHAAIALACLPFAGSALAAHDAVELRYLIERDQRQPSGDIAQRTFEGAMVLASGETRESDIRGQYRVKVALVESGGVAHVHMSVWDHQTRDGGLVGTASADVPLGGETRLTLLTSDNIHYPIVLGATRRTLP
jgi:hypothetical protein